MKFLFILSVFLLLTINFSSVRKAEYLPQLVQFESYNIGGHFIRHQSSKGKISIINTVLDLWDSVFYIEEGLADKNLISLRSANLTSHYLRHQNGKLVITEKNLDPLFERDATWKIKSGLSGTDLNSFEAYNAEGMFLRHQGGVLKISRINSELDKQDATWKIVSRNDLINKEPVTAPPPVVRTIPEREGTTSEPKNPDPKPKPRPVQTNSWGLYLGNDYVGCGGDPLIALGWFATQSKCREAGRERFKYWTSSWCCVKKD